MCSRKAVLGAVVIAIGIILLLVDSRLFFTQTLRKNRCRERVIDPANDINWRMVFPIRIAGRGVNPGGGSLDSAYTDRSRFCVCPGSSRGVVVSFHQPRFVEEITTIPGCLTLLEGVSLMSADKSLQGDIDTNASTARFQVHWYTFPIFSKLGLFKGLNCASQPPFKLIYLSEMDPTWQDDAWSVIYDPSSIVFSDLASQAACHQDALAATSGHPLDKLFWCAGSLGSIYPLTGNANTAVGRLQAAELISAKSMAKLSRLGLLWRTVGRDALCQKQPMPIWVKSQFSIDPISPLVYRGPGLPIGAAPIVWQYRPPQSLPGQESLTQIIFQEVQCCIHP